MAAVKENFTSGQNQRILWWFVLCYVQETRWQLTSTKFNPNNCDFVNFHLSVHSFIHTLINFLYLLVSKHRIPRVSWSLSQLMMGEKISNWSLIKKVVKEVIIDFLKGVINIYWNAFIEFPAYFRTHQCWYWALRVTNVADESISWILSNLLLFTQLSTFLGGFSRSI